MSTDIIAQIKQDLATAPKGVDDITQAIGARRGGSGSKRISIRGGVFRKVVGGKEVAAIEDRHMNVIFVNASPTASRTFYDTSYKEGERVSPSCWSSDSNKPDDDVENKPAKSCSECPHSIRGAQKQCRLSWRTAAVLPDDPSGDVLQLVLPATSSFGKESNGKYPFVPYVQMLAGNNISLKNVVTRMQFDTSSPTPKLLFSPAGIVPEGDRDSVDKQQTSSSAEQAVKLTVYQTDTSEEPAKQEATAQPVEVDNTAEPLKREPAKPQTDSSGGADVSDILNEWSTKD
jgi:hypothetical protein